ncbi:MAG: hypothetical protein JOZ19_05425 [Rubrobacter sp.]|nr:hypothetical protein [Rubrobacter sp.]
MPCWIKGFEEGAPDGKDAALRYPEITEPCLYGKRTNTAQVLLPILAVLDCIAQMSMGLAINF